MSLIKTILITHLFILWGCNTSTIHISGGKAVDHVSTGNNSPRLDPIQDQTVHQGSPITSVDLGDGGDDLDLDGEAITYSCRFDRTFDGTIDGTVADCSTLPGAVNFDSHTGIFNWTPDYSIVGNFEIWFKAEDGQSFNELYASFTVTSTNRPPVLDPIMVSSTVSEGTPFAAVNLSDGGDDFDVDLQPLTYNCVYETTINGTFNGPGTSCTSLPGSVSFNTSTGIMNWTPNYVAAGVYEVWYMAVDPFGGASARKLVQYTVTDYNPLPTFNITGVTGGLDTTADAKLDHVLNPTINWQSVTGANGYDVTVYESNGTTVACPTVSATGTSYSFSSCTLTQGLTYRARVVAKNALLATRMATNDLFSFTLNTAPVAADDGPYYVMSGNNITVYVLADNLASVPADPDYDADGDTLTITARTNGSKGTVIIVGGNRVSYTPTAGQTGTDTFTYTISDGRGGTSTATVSMRIISGFTWTGAVNSNWSNTGNWCGSINANNTSCAGGSTLPTTTSVVNFDGQCVNCAVDVDMAIDVREINMHSDFSGSITQNGQAMNVRAGWNQDGGTFAGGSSNITITDYLRINAGIFTSTSGTLRVSRNVGCCGSAVNNFVLGTTGVFNHNSGTVYIYGESSNGSGDNRIGFEINAPGIVFQNLTLDGADTDTSNGSNSTVLMIRALQSMTVLNRLRQVDGIVSGGIINLFGDAEFTCASTHICAQGGWPGFLSTDLVFKNNFPLVQTLTVSGASETPSLVLDGTGTVNVVSGTNDLTIAGNFRQNSGIFNAPSGWINMESKTLNCCTSNTEGFRILGGTFNSNGVSLYLGGMNGNGSGNAYTVGTVEVPLGFTVKNFHMDHSYMNVGSRWNLGATNIFHITGDFTHSDGRILGTPQFLVDGNVSFTCLDALVCAENSAAMITFQGSGTQYLNQQPGAGIAQGTWIVNKPFSLADSVEFQTDVNLTGPGQDLIIQSGKVFTDQNSLIVSDLLRLEANTLIDRGTTDGIISAGTISLEPTAEISPALP